MIAYLGFNYYKIYTNIKEYYAKKPLQKVHKQKVFYLINFFYLNLISMDITLHTINLIFLFFIVSIYILNKIIEYYQKVFWWFILRLGNQIKILYNLKKKIKYGLLLLNIEFFV